MKSTNVWELFDEWVAGRCDGALVYAALLDNEDLFNEPSKRFGLMLDKTKAAILRVFRLADLNPKTLIRLRRADGGDVTVEVEMIQMFGDAANQINEGETMYIKPQTQQ